MQDKQQPITTVLVFVVGLLGGYMLATHIGPGHHHDEVEKHVHDGE